jgi:hypothetical protein
MPCWANAARSHGRGWDEGELGPFQRARRGLGGWRNSRSVKDVFSGSDSPNCNGLTITQIGGNMAQAPAHGFPEIAH